MDRENENPWQEIRDRVQEADRNLGVFRVTTDGSYEWSPDDFARFGGVRVAEIQRKSFDKFYSDVVPNVIKHDQSGREVRLYEVLTKPIGMNSLNPQVRMHVEFGDEVFGGVGVSLAELLTTIREVRKKPRGSKAQKNRLEKELLELGVPEFAEVETPGGDEVLLRIKIPVNVDSLVEGDQLIPRDTIEILVLPDRRDMFPLSEEHTFRLGLLVPQKVGLNLNLEVEGSYRCIKREANMGITLGNKEVV